MCLHIRVVTLHWVALVVIALYLLRAPVQNLLLHPKKIPAQLELDH